MENKNSKIKCRIKHALESMGFTKNTIDIIYHGWSPNTVKQYQTYHNKWAKFCEARQCDQEETTLTILLEFFTHLYEIGHSFSGVNTAKSALLTIVRVNNDFKWKDDPIVKKFFAGYYRLRTPTAKYTNSWNVELMLEYLDNLMPLQDISLKELTHKAVALLALASGSRAQTIELMDLKNMSSNNNKLIFVFDKPLKTSKAGKSPHFLEFERFSIPSRCVVATLLEYIRRTDAFRNPKCTKLWLSHVKPHGGVGKDTISRWMKQVIHLAGIDVTHFTAHSFRMASTSTAAAAGVGMHTILETANWTAAENFEKFYHRDTSQSKDKKRGHRVQFAKAVLGGNKE